MVHIKLKVGHSYELKINEQRTIVFAVLYGFERGRNKDIYTIRIYDRKRDVEFPLEESTFDDWAKDGRIKELTAEEALAYVIG
ncbi:MAG TPA: hypothetical protein VN377_01175 [Candidatus Thermoplasmatota archaeon]|nr:hypothetical protein [Candidatus Thermoplasmatota archaeon]